MPRIQFTSNLKRFYPALSSLDIEGATISDLICKIDEQFPGIKNYIVDDQLRLRHHVNIFINEKMIRDRETLKDQVTESDQVFIMQALSGG